MEFSIKNLEIKDIECDVAIAYIFQNQQPSKELQQLDTALDGIISDFVIKKDKFEGKFAESYVLQTYGKIAPSKILLVGLGEEKELNTTKIREIGAKIIKKCEKTFKPQTICSQALECELIQAFYEGVLLGSYKFEKYKSKKSTPINNFIFAINNQDCIEKAQSALEKAEIIADSTNYARDLINESPMIATPAYLADLTLNFKEIESTIIESYDALKMGMGAFYAVSMGSNQEARFIHLKYTPCNAKKKIALIGKGITFDSGGLDIKPAASMRNMKDDMSGAAAILSIMKNIHKLNIPIEVHGIVAAAENMPSGHAYHPGDVLTAMNGKTIEVDNTDAEGRLTLADALCYASKLGVDEIIDVATLTGACVVALGQEAAAILGDKELIDKLKSTSELAGERLWELPIYKEHLEALKSDIADLKNTGGRFGGTMTAGAFLREFVSNSKWAHIDIAGTAFTDKEIRGIDKGATGSMVRTLLYYLNS